MTRKETDSIVKGTLEKKRHKLYRTYWLISELGLELLAVSVSQVNKLHTVTFQINFGSRLCPFWP